MNGRPTYIFSWELCATFFQESRLRFGVGQRRDVSE